MAKWKLSRQTFGTEEYTFSEGDEVTIGRGINNTITLSSLVISRNHCMIKIQKSQILITDLKSSNGVFVGTKKIPPNIPYVLKDADIIGIGWTAGVPLGKVQDSEKYIFKIAKEIPVSSFIDRITFQSENEFDEIVEQIANLNSDNHEPSPVIEVKPNLKRKIEIVNKDVKKEKGIASLNSDNSDKHEHSSVIEDIPNFKRMIEIVNKDVKKENVDCDVIIIKPGADIINLLSDSDNDCNGTHNCLLKKPKLELINEEPPKLPSQLNIKSENEYLQFEAFNVKQEYLGYDDEPIQIDSDSDSESEHWYLRLSQSSPGKPFTKVGKENKVDTKPEDSSYSQMDDDLAGVQFLNNEEEEEEEDYVDDLIKIPHPPGNIYSELQVDNQVNSRYQEAQDEVNSSDEANNLPSIVSTEPLIPKQTEVDEIDGSSTINKAIELEMQTSTINKDAELILGKKAQLIEPLVHLPKKGQGSHQSSATNKSKTTSSKHVKENKHTTSKKHISYSQKEERKKKLKEIAIKQKEDSDKINKNELNSTTKPVVNVKVTSTNRGSFLTDAVQVVKPMKRKESPQKSRTERGKHSSPKDDTIACPELNADTESNRKHSSKKYLKSESSHRSEHKKKHTEKPEKKEYKLKQKHETSKSKSESKISKTSSISESRAPLKSLKPLTDSEESFAGKPFSKVEPLPPKKPKKSVRFSELAPEVRYYEIEDGNKMKKTSLVKTLVDVRQMPIFSLEKITLMKILRWNPHWLEEQINNNDPPPILGHNNPPLAIFHSFNSHNQYVQLIGDLLLMEIWECLSIAYIKKRSQNIGLTMRIASLPPAPTQERHFDIFNISVDVSLPTSEVKTTLPRVGEILLVSFGTENAKHQRFFFVHNVRSLPSPPSNRNSFFNISLHATFTDKMRVLKPGEVIVGISLAYINKELSLFEAMAYMAGSPLSNAILRPKTHHFMRSENIPPISMNCQWTMTLNPSQQAAVQASVGAALSDQPSIQMVQGPPGTGKSSVICAIVMKYFYDLNGKKQNNRGKILICATSNAAVDELVIRLLNIRQNLPKEERFRMVRVGRAEAMHPRARDVSSQQLAQRDTARLNQDPAPAHPGLNEEIAHIEAKINMWRTAAQDAASKDKSRVAYCQGRVTELVRRITLLRGGGGGGGDEVRPEQLAAAERRIVECADIVMTTLASAHNNKMKGLKRRIALCIVDEAGQAIEPETLIPLTLDVTKLTLIGDPQQLPGYICSQRAKKHGLGESLFSRLTSSTETWPGGSPVVLLNQQYRMHEAIADYPNRAFYGSRILTVTQPRPELAIPPYLILGISSGDKGQNASGANETEAWGVARLVVALSTVMRARGLSLAVITPYNAHKDLVKRNLRALQQPTESQVEVNTVDSFQGQERDVVVVSLARSHGVGFLTDAGRMNVMLTRARHALLVCLNPHAILKNHQWRTLLEDATDRNLFRTLPYKMCQSTSQISTEEILKQSRCHVHFEERKGAGVDAKVVRSCSSSVCQDVWVSSFLIKI